MKRLLVGMLLASLPLFAWAQQDSILDQPPRDDQITASPLPPLDRDMRPDDPNAPEPEPDMVPNPLPAPNGSKSPMKPKAEAGRPQRGGWIQMGSAVLQTLDKVNVRGDTLTVKVGETARYGSLEIAVRGCFVRTPERPADATGFLVIHDARGDGTGFSGWMVKSAPYMSMLAHPIYDVRVVGCAP